MVKRKMSKKNQAAAAITPPHIVPVETKKRKGVNERRGYAELSAHSKLKQHETIKTSSVLYCRVSSDESVESNLSIPDQEMRMKKYASERGWSVLKVYKEEGVSAKTQNRPEFNKMLNFIRENPTLVSKIIVHSTSRFARNAADYRNITDEMHSLGVELVSITQTFMKDTGGYISESATAIFDEYHSIRTSTDVKRTMGSLARQGYYVGGVLPLGYMAVPESPGSSRKLIVVNEEERPLVEMIFNLAFYGDAKSSPLGIKSIVNRLNQQTILTRNGSPFSVAYVHRLLTNPIYKGAKSYSINQSQNRWSEGEAETIIIPAPAIIAESEYDRLQAFMQSKNPRTGVAKAFSSPLLLGGIARCTCGAGLTLRTGTGKQKTVYRYYHCGNKARKGATLCTGQTVPEAVLDQAVIDCVVDRLLTPQRLRDLLGDVHEKMLAETSTEEARIASIGAKIAELQGKYENLLSLAALSNDIKNDKTFLERVEEIVRELNRNKSIFTKLLANRADDFVISDDTISKFSDLMIGQLRATESSLKKAYISSVVRAVEVTDNEIWVYGSFQKLASSMKELTQDNHSNSSAPKVRRYVRNWCTRQDSNL